MPTSRFPEPGDERRARSSLGRFGAPVTPGGQRPPNVAVAGIAGFLEAGLLFLAALAYVVAGTREPSFAAFGAVFLALCLACVLGSVRALQGRNRTVLAAAGGIAAAIALVLIVVSVAGGTGFNPFSALIVLLGVSVVVLLFQPPSQDWFSARRGG